MKIVCVAGGSYKSFYVNHFLKLKNCDLLIFNSNIIYDYHTKEELLGSGVVTKEMMHLAKTLNCVVVAGIDVYAPNLIKSVLVCDGDKIYFSPIIFGAKIEIKNKTFIVGGNSTNFKNHNKIVLDRDRIYPNLENCNNKKLYIFLDDYGATLVKDKKSTRKFSKISIFNIK